jgi:hypothetical protein
MIVVKSAEWTANITAYEKRMEDAKLKNTSDEVKMQCMDPACENCCAA